MVYVKNDVADEHIYGSNTIKNICRLDFDAYVPVTYGDIFDYGYSKLP